MAGKADTAPARLHVIVRGRVQGVGFRWFVRERARALDLAGWVRNLPDGSVEVAASGEPGALDQLRRGLRRGPEGAEVRAVEEEEELGELLPTPFGILR